MDLRDRVTLRMNQLGLKPFHVAKRLGGTSSNIIHSLLSGRTKTFRDTPKLAEALETSVEWLLTGEGQEVAPSAKRPYRAPDPKYMQILTICLREWRKPEYNHIDEKAVLEIAHTIYEQTKTVKEKEIMGQADCLMAHQARQARGH